MSIKEIKFGTLVKDTTVADLKQTNRDTQLDVLEELGKGADNAAKDADKMLASNAKLLDAMKKVGM